MEPLVTTLLTYNLGVQALASIHRWVGWVERAVTNECPCYWDIGTCLESKITK